MHICIAAQGAGLSSRFEPHFARAPFSVFSASGTGRTDAIRNGDYVNTAKIGQNVLKLLPAPGARAVNTGRAGDTAQKIHTGSALGCLPGVAKGSSARPSWQ